MTEAAPNNLATPETLPLPQAHSRLARLWYIASGSIFVLLLFQSFGTVYRGRLSEVWGWFLPTIMPTLSLISSVLATQAVIIRQPKDDQEHVPLLEASRSYFALTYWLSITYFAVILITILAAPLVASWQSTGPTTSEEITSSAPPSHEATPASILVLSSLWLAPLQSIVVASMGALFFPRSKELSRQR